MRDVAGLAVDQRDGLSPFARGTPAASITTGFPNTPATIHRVGVQTDKSDYTRSCSRTKTSVRFIGFASSGKPASATMTVWTKRKHSSRLRETGYLQWSRGRSITYYSKKACTSQY